MEFNRSGINEFYINKSGIRMHVKLEFPGNAPKLLPIAIIIHGLTGNMEEGQITGCAEAFRANGIATLRVELFGHGMSDGEFSEHNIFEWVNQTLFLIDYVKEWDFVDGVYLSGHSQGGLTALLVAGLKNHSLKGLVLLSPFISIVDSCKNGQFFETSFDPDNIPTTIKFWGENVISGNYLRIGQILPIDKAVEDYKGPVLLVHGGADGAVPKEGTIAAAEKYSDSELVIIEGDGHCYENHLDKMIASVSDYLARHI